MLTFCGTRAHHHGSHPAPQRPAYLSQPVSQRSLQEAEKLLDEGLPLPAYDHLLKLSHTFNLLDARGAVGLSERQANFGRMRALAKRVSELFVARRQALELPLGEVPADAVRPSAQYADPCVG